METVTLDTIRVIIIDDQEPFRSAARMVIELAEGFEVVGEAETGEDGVALTATRRPDLVLMDVNLPGIDGFEATRRILEPAGTAARAMVSRPIVVVLSTYEALDVESQALAAGAVAFIPKSEFGPDILEAVWAQATTG